MGKSRKVKVSKIKKNSKNYTKNQKRMQDNMKIINELKNNK